MVGGGPAGSSAALAALQLGADVTILEKSRFPRHKVCGEFLSPEAVSLLDELGAGNRFLDAGPARIRYLLLHFGARTRRAMLPDLAYGLSRYVFDHLLFRTALERGAGNLRETVTTPTLPAVVASGRAANSARGRRVFGFKAHFRGPAADTIELHFFKSGYVGINSVENGVTNICGLADESALAAIGFEYDALIAAVPSLKDRTAGMERTMGWMTTGPLRYGNRLDDKPVSGLYAAGDALSFVDPFTGSGMYCAVLTGSIAGRSAAMGISAEAHLIACRRAIGRPYAFASAVRSALGQGWAQYLAPLVPAAWLYRLTRPRGGALPG